MRLAIPIHARTSFVPMRALARAPIRGVRPALQPLKASTVSGANVAPEEEEDDEGYSAEDFGGNEALLTPFEEAFADAGGQSGEELLSVIVLGESDALVRQRIFPVLFFMFVDGTLPPNWILMGYSKAEMSEDEFRARIAGSIKIPAEGLQKYFTRKIELFTERCFYSYGEYDKVDDYTRLDQYLMELEEGAPGVNRVFYLALPPQEHQWAETVSETTAASPNGWTRWISDELDE